MHRGDPSAIHVNMSREGRASDLILAEYLPKTNSCEVLCPHQEYGSIEGLLDHFREYVRSGMIDEETLDDKEVAHGHMNQLLHDFKRRKCQKCALNFTANLPSLLRELGEHSRRPLCPVSIPPLICFYFENVQNYYGVSIFIFHQSNLWLTYLSSITDLFNDIDQNLTLHSSLDVAEVEVINLQLCHVARHMHRWKHVHWKCFLKNHFWRWLSCTGILLIWGHMRSESMGDINSFVLYMFVITVFSFNRIQNGQRHSSLRIKLIKSLNSWFKSMRDVISTNPFIANYNLSGQGIGVITEFLDLQNANHLAYFLKKYRRSNEKIHEEKWGNMRCSNTVCGVTRAECNARRQLRRSFSKCKSCRVARYCSRKCQKADWKTHKKNCIKLTVMRLKSATLFK